MVTEVNRKPQAHSIRHVSRLRRFDRSLHHGKRVAQSAVACYLCARLILRDFGQSGSVSLAACINLVVGMTAYPRPDVKTPSQVRKTIKTDRG